jgi:tetratricopeptide (TPR) repeat protein
VRQKFQARAASRREFATLSSMASGRPRLVPLAAAFSALLASAQVFGDDAGQAQASWATAQARTLTREGEIHVRCNEGDSALRSFLEAIRFDATYPPAYLALAEIYEARGDFGEADRALSMGIEHVVGFFDALWRRGKLRGRQHRGPEAIGDLEAAASLRPEEAVLRDLSAAYVSARALPAALAVARRRLRLAEGLGDAASIAQARLEVRALAGIVAEADPVSLGARGRGPVRHALWAVDQVPAPKRALKR